MYFRTINLVSFYSLLDPISVKITEFVVWIPKKQGNLSLSLFLSPLLDRGVPRGTGNNSPSVRRTRKVAIFFIFLGYFVAWYSVSNRRVRAWIPRESCARGVDFARLTYPIPLGRLFFSCFSSHPPSPPFFSLGFSCFLDTLTLPYVYHTSNI